MWVFAGRFGVNSFCPSIFASKQQKQSPSPPAPGTPKGRKRVQRESHMTLSTWTPITIIISLSVLKQDGAATKLEPEIPTGRIVQLCRSQNWPELGPSQLCFRNGHRDFRLKLCRTTEEPLFPKKPSEQNGRNR